jgi:CRP-like cAMP-binding protein
MLSHKTVLSEPRQPIRTAYFPLNCVTSILNPLEDGHVIEVATVGNEGFNDLPAILGTENAPTKTICQVPGDALQIEADVLLQAYQRIGPLHTLFQRYTQSLVYQISQTAACNRVHPMEERCSRWLLMTHDRVGADEFSLTQEFLAYMLGVRRPSVTVSAGILQEAGLIRYSRGHVRIVDRENLEFSSCECYRSVRQEYERLLG